MSLDPVLVELFKGVPLELQLPIDWQETRERAAKLLPLIVGNAPATEVASVEPVEIDGVGGKVRLRVYRPVHPTAMTVHYIHGGGWTVGDLDTVDHTIRYLCDAIPAVVVSSTYRLAPEHPFPAGFEDTLAAAHWVIDNVERLGGDVGRIAIAGDSAGGNLAAGVAIALRDEGHAEAPSKRSPLSAQLLLYPSVDLRPESWSRPSRIADADPSLRCDAIKQTRTAYIGDADPEDWRVSPIATDDFSNLPPAVIAVLTVDPLRDEAVEYAARLQEAGVRAEVIEFSNLTHGFVHLRHIVPAAAIASDEVVARFRTLMEEEAG